jgi:adenylate kinase family enzyme
VREHAGDSVLKVVVIGTGGGGKSTFCRKLGEILRVPVHHLDRIQFTAGWKNAPLDRFEAEHDKILDQDSWIIDGWGTPESIDRRLAAADTIVIVNYPIRVHYWRTLKRQLIGVFRPVPGFPERCTIWPLWRRGFSWVRCAHRDLVPKLARQAELHQRHATVHHVSSPSQLYEMLKEARVAPAIV